MPFEQIAPRKSNAPPVLPNQVMVTLRHGPKARGKILLIKIGKDVVKRFGIEDLHELHFDVLIGTGRDLGMIKLQRGKWSPTTFKFRPNKSASWLAGQLRSFIERIERLEEEKANLSTDIREVYALAKSCGFEPKVMRQVIRLRKLDREDRQEQEALLDLYLSAIGS